MSNLRPDEQLTDAIDPIPQLVKIITKIAAKGFRGVDSPYLFCYGGVFQVLGLNGHLGSAAHQGAF